MVRHGVVLLVATLLHAPDPGAPSGADPGGPSWRWPLRPPPAVLRGFAPPEHPWEAGHRGVDLAARPGQPVYAAGPGRVTFAGDLAGRGVVTVDHGAIRTTYLPVRPSVRPGRTVTAGTRIGVVGVAPDHCGDVTCLHWGLLRGAGYLDPLALLGLGPVRLLPWWGALPPAVPRPVRPRRLAPGGRNTSPARRPDDTPPPAPGAAGALRHVPRTGDRPEHHGTRSTDRRRLATAATATAAVTTAVLIAALALGPPASVRTRRRRPKRRPRS